MRTERIKSNHLQFVYELKEGTSTSYYLKAGKPGFLPERIGITRQIFAHVNRTGGNHLEKITGQIKGTFRRNEESVYKKQKPFWLHTSIYEVTKFPVFAGYGDIGITSQTGRTQGTGDLIIIKASDTWNIVSLHIFRGMLFEKDQVFPYLSNLLKQQSQA